MHDDDEPTASATQDEWRDVCARVRAQLARRVGDVAAMSAGEMHCFVQAIENALWNEVRAETFDAAVLERRRTLERESLFGG
jgi:hypothetical protein